MPIGWTHTYVFRPTEFLQREFAEFPEDEGLPRVPVAEVWTSPSVGDHDYAGQERDAVTHLKLVFLAKLHQLATAPGEETERARVARRLVARGPLTEAFFDARWIVEDLGPFTYDCELTIDTLLPENMTAVEGPPRVVRSSIAGGPDRTLREQWAQAAALQGQRRQRIEEFVHLAVVRLCRRFAVSSAEIRAPGSMHLGLEDRLRIDGIAQERPSRLVLRLEPGQTRWRERKLEFKLYRNASWPPRGELLCRGNVYGERRNETDEWALDIETVERTPL